MIKVDGLCKKYKNKVLDNVSFCVKRGECVAIIGVNGCGKTTLLSIMAGIRKPDKGEIYYAGELSNNKKTINKYVGYVPQENPLVEELSVRDNLVLWYNGSKKTLEQELKKGMLKMLGIDEFAHKQVSKISGGMKRRLSLGIALINKASILILDEPTAALDLVCKEEIMAYLKEYTNSGGTVILTTHDKSEIEICDKIYVIKNGMLSPLPKGLSSKDLTDKLQ